ncbi:hypothetical protein AVEN_260608-1 [Araneus ventricosus]|uniref:Uncharacterized protein n=1 Tax=Araneus ventricosus TaxID=182803 RepID=A0A4Y2W9U3_ARAVE|nr:hypothetical protein AVEN_260608-1 [Araneus ventricosus]
MVTYSCMKRSLMEGAVFARYGSHLTNYFISLCGKIPDLVHSPVDWSFLTFSTWALTWGFKESQWYLVPPERSRCNQPFLNVCVNHQKTSLNFVFSCFIQTDCKL